jgi:SAM-dependent methyltransferase
MTQDSGQNYVLAGNQRFQEAISRRSLSGPFGAFFLPHLERGLRVLDCGCGPGSITLGLAECVAPGDAVGIDTDEAALDAARQLAEASKVSNLRYERADVYALPFSDAVFDRVFVSSLLEHLSNPRRALDEMLRVLKPGGIAGIGATAGSGFVHPETPEIDHLLAVSERVLRLWGGNPTIGRDLRGLLLEAGFEDVEFTATGIGNGTDLQVQRAADTLIDRSLSGRMLQTILEQGWMDEEQIEATKAAIRVWGRQPHAVAVTMYGTAVGRKPG